MTAPVQLFPPNPGDHVFALAAAGSQAANSPTIGLAVDQFQELVNINNAILALLASAGDPSDPAWSGGAGNQIELLKAIAEKIGGATGSTGLDFSANQPALPNVGGNWPASGPYNGWSLLGTVPASSTRRQVSVQNTSGSPIAILRDDGTAAGGSQPTNATVFGLAGGALPGVDGGVWQSDTFLGRVQIFCADAAAQVSVIVQDTVVLNFSTNPPALPNVGANFGNSGPYANFFYLGSMAANTARRLVEIINTSTDQIAVLLDDGTAAGGSPPVNATVFGLSPASVGGVGGGQWASTDFLGRVQIYAPANSAFVALFED